jgi:hypothetical protein
VLSTGKTKHQRNVTQHIPLIHGFPQEIPEIGIHGGGGNGDIW